MKEKKKIDYRKSSQELVNRKNKVYDGKSLNKITNYYKKHPNYFT